MKLSALVLAKNEENMIEDCLRQLDFVDEIIILDQYSKDNTERIAKKFTDQIIKTHETEFDKNRNLLAQAAKGEWLLYVDCDERFSRNLKKEIKEAIEKENIAAFYIPRKNYVLGKWLRYGGFWPDYVPKLFKKVRLEGWQGTIHESPIFRGESSKLINPVEHLTAGNLNKMLKKTIAWARIEAELAYKANHPRVNKFRVIKTFVGEFIYRYILKFGLLDGVQGLAQAIFQGYHRSIMLVYLWELQNSTQEKFKPTRNV